MAEHFNADLFAACVRRTAERYTLREVAAQSGVSASTLSRIERGALPDVQTLYALCVWMQLSPAVFLLPEQQVPASSAVEAQLREALRQIVAICRQLEETNEP